MEALTIYVEAHAQPLILLLVFIATVALCIGGALWVTGGKTVAQRRLEHVAHPESIVPDDDQQTAEGFTVRLAHSAAKFIVPEDGWDHSGIKTRLVRAGYRNTIAVRTFWGNKIIFALVLPGMILLALLVSGLDTGEGSAIVMLLFAMVVGFYLPDLFLRRRINARRLTLTEGFPDAMDLFVVCVEAGLGLDAAIQRVGTEIAHSHKELGEEFSILSLELRAGKSRTEALRALAERVDIEEVHELASLLIQADHFGTSIAEALRGHANDMRTLRIQRARERAAKLPVKLIFPILFLIFPSLFLVILGPTIVSISRMLSTMAK